jgi:hypothetical protein
VRAEFRQISEQSSGRHHCLRQRLAEHKESASPLLGNENHANIPKIHKLNRLQQLAGFPLGPEYLGGARLGVRQSVCIGARNWSPRFAEIGRCEQFCTDGDV